MNNKRERKKERGGGTNRGRCIQTHILLGVELAFHTPAHRPYVPYREKIDPNTDSIFPTPLPTSCPTRPAHHHHITRTFLPFLHDFFSSLSLSLASPHLDTISFVRVEDSVKKCGSDHSYIHPFLHFQRIFFFFFFITLFVSFLCSRKTTTPGMRIYIRKEFDARVHIHRFS